MNTPTHFVMASNGNVMQSFVQNWVGPIIFLFFITMSLVAVKNREWMKVVALAGMGAMATILITFGSQISGSRTKVNDKKKTTPTQSSASQNTTNSSANNHHTNIDYSLVLSILGGIVALIIIAGLAYIVKKYAKGKRAIIAASNERKLAEFKRIADLDKQLTDEWNNLIIKHTNILDEWNAYDRDIKKLLELPAMRNFSLPEVGAVIDALDAAADVKTLKYPRGIENVYGTDYYKAVKNCEKAFDDAMHVAINHKNKTMSAKERRQLALASQLLKTAMDEAASSNERQLAYSRIMNIMEGLRIEVPKGVIKQIENNTRLLLEA